MNERKTTDSFEPFHEDDFVNPLGDEPAHIDTIPGIIGLNRNTGPSTDLSREVSEEIERTKPWILEFAQKRRADVAAAITSRGREIFIAAGAGALVAAVAGVVIYRHRHQDSESIATTTSESTKEVA